MRICLHVHSNYQYPTTIGVLARSQSAVTAHDRDRNRQLFRIIIQRWTRCHIIILTRCSFCSQTSSKSVRKPVTWMPGGRWRWFANRNFFVPRLEHWQKTSSQHLLTWHTIYSTQANYPGTLPESNVDAQSFKSFLVLYIQVVSISSTTILCQKLRCGYNNCCAQRVCNFISLGWFE